ncbi:GntR family transcriptional regulator [Virgibacillus pantothenticus]|uniref:GntR family transcriptional regulator n=1 Tax=Virgibacillus pantothenticus TaxID=1473 RepID=A0A0L0QT97_VIRPA|nr:GntR family transcriptional regulator [Virgibacillus pantothenticus]KNE21806.1 GntR family transcriptional regulator [Virgibacillus pantothenticus]MED3739076.1 GntR family transcriptional regulator [Virgibacillus pantothenticus]SIT12571.1 transcriptional regulator, GntR family [Virgibacillus pantothenticus]
MTNNAIPLYVQIADRLRDNIKMGKWKEGDKIPTEVELCNIYDVSRITIRKAIDELVKEDLLRRQRAKGTFVTSFVEPSDNFTVVKSFTEEMRELGEKARTMDVKLEITEADKRLAMYLNMNIGDKVMILKRIRGDSKQAFVYSVTYIKSDENFSLDPNDYYGSFYTYLNEHGIQVKDNKEVVEAILPNYEVRKALNINKNEPVLKRTRFTSCKSKNFYEYTINYYIGNSYKYYLDFN